MSKHWFYRQMFSYLPVFFVISIVLIVSMFLSITNLSEKATVDANEVFAKHVFQSIDYQLQGVEQLIVNEILNNDRFMFFFNGAADNKDYFSMYEMSTKVKNLKVANPLIDSIYLFRSDDLKILTESSFLPLNRFVDQAFILQLTSTENTALIPNWTGVRLYKEFLDSEHVTTVVSLVKKVPPPLGNQGIIVVNVKTSTLRQIVQEMSSANVSYATFVDRDGQFLFDPPTDNNQRELVQIKSDYTQWELHSGLKNGKLIEIGSTISYVYIFVVVLSILIGVLWIVYITRHNYKPIESIVGRIHSYSKKKNQSLFNENGKDELKFIENAIDTLIEQTNQYQKEYEENLILKRRHVLAELVEGSRSLSKEEWNREMEGIGLSNEFDQLCIVIIEIDKYSDFSNQYSHRDQYLLKFVLSSVVNEMTEPLPCAAWSEWLTNNQMCVLLQLMAKESNPETMVSDICQQLLHWVQANLGFTVTIGIGQCVSDTKGVVETYDSSLEALKYKSVLGMNRVIHCKDIESHNQGDVYKSLHHLRSLAQMFRLNDERWNGEMGSFFAEIQDRLYSRAEILSMMNYMVYHLHREMLDLQPEIQEIWKSEGMPKLNELAESFDTIDELEKKVTSVLIAVEQKVILLREKRTNHHLIQEVRTYIKTHYANPDLSLAHLEEAFGVNGKYLSQLFKEEFGEKFVDYVAQVRIERAKALLMETSLPIQDIANQIGYTTSMTFIRVFKKRISMTPGDYRKVH